MNSLGNLKGVSMKMAFSDEFAVEKGRFPEGYRYNQSDDIHFSACQTVTPTSEHRIVSLSQPVTAALAAETARLRSG